MTTKEFIKSLDRNDAEIAKKFENCKTPDEAYNAAKTLGVTDSFEEFTKAMSEIKEAMEELSDDDLENVAGGNSMEDAVKMSEAVSNVSCAPVEAAAGLGVMASAAL